MKHHVVGIVLLAALFGAGLGCQGTREPITTESVAKQVRKFKLGVTNSSKWKVRFKPAGTQIPAMELESGGIGSVEFEIDNDVEDVEIVIDATDTVGIGPKQTRRKKLPAFEPLIGVNVIVGADSLKVVQVSVNLGENTTAAFSVIKPEDYTKAAILARINPPASQAPPTARQPQ